MLKVLIIDDQKSIKNALMHLLQNKGIYVETSQSVEQAESLVVRHKFDYIISDMKMSGKSGLDFAKHLFEKKYPARFILISAFFSLDDAIDALRVNVYDMFTKPFDHNKIIMRILENAKKNTDFSHANDLYDKLFPNKINREITSFNDNYFLTNRYKNRSSLFNFFHNELENRIHYYCFVYSDNNIEIGYIYGLFQSLSKLNCSLESILDIIRHEYYFEFSSEFTINVVFIKEDKNKKQIDVYSNGKLNSFFLLMDKSNAIYDPQIVDSNCNVSINYVHRWFCLINTDDHDSNNVFESIINSSFIQQNILFPSYQSDLKEMKDIKLSDPVFDYISLHSIALCCDNEMMINLCDYYENYEKILKIIHLNIQYFIHNDTTLAQIMTFVAEVLSRLYFNKYKDMLKLSIVVMPYSNEAFLGFHGKMIKKTFDFAGKNFADSNAEDMLNEPEPIIPFDDLIVSDNIIKLGVKL